MTTVNDGCRDGDSDHVGVIDGFWAGEGMGGRRMDDF